MSSKYIIAILSLFSVKTELLEICWCLKGQIIEPKKKKIYLFVGT